MTSDTDPASDSASHGDGEAELSAYATRLADGVEAAIGPWVERQVAAVANQWQAGLGAELAAEASRAGRQARAVTGVEVRELLGRDVDHQATSPLSVVRAATRFPTAVLRAAGVPPVDRDDFKARAFPDDIYDLSPATFADLSDELAEPGLVWGAAKAYVVMSRHRQRSRPEGAP